MARFSSCNASVVNSTLLVNISLHSGYFRCPNSSVNAGNSTLTAGSWSSMLPVEGAAKYFCYVFYALVLFFGIFGNIIVFYVVGYRKTKRNSGDVYILSLACADFLASLIAPMVMLNDLITDFVGWVYGEALCHVMPAITPTTLCASAWSLVFISVDRLRVISKPMDSRLPNTHLYATIAFIWLVSLGFGIPHALRLQLTDNVCSLANGTIIGTPNFLIFIGISLFGIWYIPYIIMVITYYLCARALKANAFKHENNRAMEQRNKQDAKIMRMFIIVVVIFLLLTMPYAVLYFYISYMAVYRTTDVNTRLHSTLNYTLFAVASANGCVNPVIYAKMHREINAYLRNIIQRLSRCCCQFIRMTNRDAPAPSSSWSVSTSNTDQSKL